MNTLLVTLMALAGATLSYHNAPEHAARTLAARASSSAARVAETKEKFAGSSRFLQQFEFRAYGVLAPGVKDVPPGVNIPPWAYEIDYSELGPIVQTEIKVTQALATFGKISHIIRAAKSERLASEAERLRVEREIAKNLKLLVVHYSTLLSMKDLLTEVAGKLKEVIKKATVADADLTTIELNKLRGFLHATLSKLSEVTTGIE